MTSLRLRVHRAPLTETPPPPLLLVGGPVSIGRRDDNGWVLPDSTASVSRKHATVDERNGVWRVIDESANGTLHNGQIVGRGNARPISAGDVIKIGDYEILVEPAPDAGGGGRPAMGPAPQPLADPYGIADLGNAGFGAPPPPPSGPSPFDPTPPERLAEAPRAVDLFGDFGAHQVAPGVGVRGGPDTPPVAAFGSIDAPVDLGPGPSPFGGPAPSNSPFGSPGGGQGSPFGGPDPVSPFGGQGAGSPSPFGGHAASGTDDWGSAAPHPAPNAGALVNDPFSSTGGGSVFGDQFGSADAIRNPLAGGGGAPRADAGLKPVDPFNASGAPSVFGAEGSPFGGADPVGYGRDQAPPPLGFDAVPLPEIGGPSGGAPALPSDWNATPASGAAPPPPDLDPIEQALAGLKAADRPSPAPSAQPPTPRPVAGDQPPPSAALFGGRQPVPQPAVGGIPRPAPAAPAPGVPFTPTPPPGRPDANLIPPGTDFFGTQASPPPAPTEDVFAHPAAPAPAPVGQVKPGTAVGTPTAPAATPSAAFQPHPASRPRPTPTAPRPAVAPVAAARPTATAGDALVRAFMEGAAMQQIPADLDLVQAMRTLGSSTRAIVSTLARLLEARRLLKGEFRITQTVVGARENNPLKFSVDENELMLVLLGSVRPGFQRGEAAVWDAGRDLEAHQLAMLAAFRAVLDAVFARLSPDAVASGEEAGFFGRVLPQARDAALWERYVKTYGDLRQDIGNTLAGRLGQIFAEAYEAENGRRGGSR
jgi:FHA domain-containing protein